MSPFSVDSVVVDSHCMRMCMMICLVKYAVLFHEASEINDAKFSIGSFDDIA